MVRQARSEQTRRKIIAAAVEVFGEIGYGAAGLGDIIERAEMTKGALYYHFDSKESLATAIIEEAGANLYKTFRSITESSAPALESAIHGIFAVADLMCTDDVTRAGVQLLRTLAEFNATAAQIYDRWLGAMARLIERAADEGDVRPGVNAHAVSTAIVSAMVGAELIAHTRDRSDDLVQLIAATWEILLVASVTDESLPYFREFLARESLRKLPQTPSIS